MYSMLKETFVIIFGTIFVSEIVLLGGYLCNTYLNWDNTWQNWPSFCKWTITATFRTPLCSYQFLCVAQLNGKTYPNVAKGNKSSICHFRFRLNTFFGFLLLSPQFDYMYVPHLYSKRDKTELYHHLCDVWTVLLMFLWLLCSVIFDICMDYVVT